MSLSIFGEFTNLTKEFWFYFGSSKRKSVFASLPLWRLFQDVRPLAACGEQRLLLSNGGRKGRRTEADCTAATAGLGSTHTHTFNGNTHQKGKG